MTIQETRKLFAFNAWANNRVFETLRDLPESEYKQDLKTSFGTIHATMTHLVAAEKIWLSRLAGKPETALMTDQDTPSVESLKSAWEDIAARMARFLAKLDDGKLQEELSYVTTEGKEYRNTLQQILQHIVNHSSYHRGQIAGMLRQVGAKAANTDLITFYRLTAP